MARSKVGPLSTPGKRLKLPNIKVHTETLAAGYYLTYTRHKNDRGGTWTARYFNKTTGKQVTKKIGRPDDYVTADGALFLDYDQACDAAMKWCGEQDRLAYRLATGIQVTSTKETEAFTINSALDLYLADSEMTRHNHKNFLEDKNRIEVNIRAYIGSYEVRTLNKRVLTDWRDNLVTRGKHIRTAQGSPEKFRPPATPEELRMRKVTVNRSVATLKGALNFAAEEGLIPDDFAPWRSLKPFANVTAARQRYLTLDEQKKLIGAIQDEDFRDLVLGALTTGARYNELANLRVRDYQKESQRLYIAFGKGRGSYKTRWVNLSEEAIALFDRRCAGHDDEDLVFTHTPEKRLGRKHLEDYNQWKASDTHTILEKSWKAAGIQRVIFHELRHSYASYLVNQGVPLAYVASQLGHSNISMVEEHYGHLCPDAKAKSLREHSAKLTEPLKPRQTLAQFILSADEWHDRREVALQERRAKRDTAHEE